MNILNNIAITQYYFDLEAWLLNLENFLQTTPFNGSFS